MNTIRVAIIEDEPHTRQLLQNAVNDPGMGMLCVGAFASPEEAIAEPAIQEANVVLVDIHMPGGISGIDCVRILKKNLPGIEFMMCTSLEDAENIFNALQAGATGYITKSTPTAKILEAIRDVYNGGSPMSSQVARKVMGHFYNTDVQQKDAELQKLSGREREILDLLAKGYRYKEIAAMLFVSIETVRKHIHNIYEKLQVNSRTDAINKAYTHRQ